MSNNNILLEKLDSFIRKYYKNRLLRGLFFLTAISTGFYLFIVFSEYLFYFSTTIRMVLFYSYLIIALFLISQFIVIPLLKLNKLGKTISYEQAAVIVGHHFSEVQDKLLNTLQLLKENRERVVDDDLLKASIEQKTKALRVLKFNKAITYKSNSKYLKFAVPPLVILFCLLIFAPRMVSEPTQRIIHFQNGFTRPLGFNLEIVNANLKVLQQEDFELKIRFKGEQIPDEAFLLTEGVSYRMEHHGKDSFLFLFKVLQGDIRFKIRAGLFTSEEFILKVYPKPIILNFDIELVYPAYINRPKEMLSNTGDLIIPEGTVVSWEFNTKNVNAIGFLLEGKNPEILKSVGQMYNYSTRISESTTYLITPVNEYTYQNDTLKFQIFAIKDRFPTISLTYMGDTASSGNLVYGVEIKDDYGFTALTFNYELFDDGDSVAKEQEKIDIAIDKKANGELIFFNKDLSDILSASGQKLQYYFEVTDNDGFNGPKSTRTPVLLMKVPTINERYRNEISTAESIRSAMDRSREDAIETTRSIESLKKKLVDQKGLSWDEKKKVEEVIRSAEKILKDVDRVGSEQVKSIGNEDQVRISERLIEKQRELNLLMEGLYTEEMKRMVDEMKKLVQNMDKEKLSALMERMKVSMKDLEKELDRSIELMKKLEFEKNLEFVVKELRELAKDQGNLADAGQKDEVAEKDLGNSQEGLTKRFDTIRKNFESLKEQGLQLLNPIDLKSGDAIGDSIRKNLEKSQKELERGHRKAGIKSQRNAEDLMQKMASNLEETQSESEDDELAEDADNIRMILENLLRLSFLQEGLMTESRSIPRNDPRYPVLLIRQSDIKTQVEMVKDSLESIGRRQVFIQPIIKKEIVSITDNINSSIDDINKRNIGSAITRQQYCMTGLNNLANLLSESLEKMNNQMQMNMQSKGGLKSCSQPKSQGGKRSMKSMREMQSQIGKQLEELKKGLENSKGKGSKPMSGGGDMKLNEQVARMAAQQEALRNALAKQMEESSGGGLKNNENLNRALKSMDETERDILNKKISAETIRRQQEIVSRLLESEKAEQKREYDMQRMSTEAKNIKNGNLNEFSKYNKTLIGTSELLKYHEAPVNGYFKSKVNGYVLKIAK